MVDGHVPACMKLLPLGANSAAQDRAIGMAVAVIACCNIVIIQGHNVLV